jgi:hypothetical protein
MDHTFAQADLIGFDFAGRTPDSPQGDTAAPTHLFIHDYPIPGPGFITGVRYRNDTTGDPTGPEAISVLVLRPEGGGWRVIHRIDLPDSAFRHGASGDTTFMLPAPLPVQANDILAHWQYQGPGPIPPNVRNHVDGVSHGQFGFNSSDVDVGKFIVNAGFTGQRDYFINLIFTPAP